MKGNYTLGCTGLVLGTMLGCGSGGGAGGAGGGTTSSTATGSSKSTSVSASSSSKSASAGTGGANQFVVPVCTGIPASPPSNGSCYTVPVGTGGAGGGAEVQCNPVKDTQCKVASGDACDFNATGFICFPAPNTVDLCGTCDLNGNLFCKDGLTCVPTDATGKASQCAKFCCTDADCGGAAGSCNLSITGDPNVGVCGSVSG